MYFEKQVMKLCLTAACFLLMPAFAFPALADSLPDRDGQPGKEYGEALDLYREGMYDRSMLMFKDMADATGNEDAYGYYVLNAVHLQVPGYEHLMENFISWLS